MKMDVDLSPELGKTRLLKVSVCLTCGDEGFEEAIVYCSKCGDYAMRRYCLAGPVILTDKVTWLCEDCEEMVVEAGHPNSKTPESEKKNEVVFDPQPIADPIWSGSLQVFSTVHRLMWQVPKHVPVLENNAYEVFDKIAHDPFREVESESKTERSSVKKCEPKEIHVEPDLINLVPTFVKDLAVLPWNEKFRALRPPQTQGRMLAIDSSGCFIAACAYEYRLALFSMSTSMTGSDIIDEIFDSISYNKGASVIRMLQSYLGAESFQRSLASYIKRSACSNAKTKDLWAALEEDDYIVLSNPISIIQNVQGVAADAVPDLLDYFKQFCINVLQHSVERLGWDPKLGETHDDALLKGEIPTSLAECGHDLTLDEASKRFQAFLEDRNIPLYFAAVQDHWDVVNVIMDANVDFASVFKGHVISGTTSGVINHYGILEGWFGVHWWNGRTFVLVFATVFVFAPLVSFKRIDSLRFTSALSVGLAVVFLIIVVGISIIKIISGGIGMPGLFPVIIDAASVFYLFTVVLVLVTAYICHYNVHNIDNELEDSSWMHGVVRTSLTLCASVYSLTSFFGFLLFGDNTLDDVLSNFDTDLGIPFGSALNDAVRFSYAAHLVLVYPVVFYGLRVNIDGLLFTSSRRPLVVDNFRFASITISLVGIIFIGANFIPSIWDIFQFTGATAAFCLAFIFPAANHSEESRQEWLLSELSGKRPLFGPGLPKTEEIADVLDTFHVIAELPSDSFGAYIISMATTSSDVLDVELLQRECGVKQPLRVVPLFEKIADLETAPAALARLFSIEWYRNRINGKQEVGVEGVIIEDSVDTRLAQESDAKLKGKESVAVSRDKFSVMIVQFRQWDPGVILEP